MKLTNDENIFDPTPKLKSSPIPISFVSFNQDDENCICCGDKYTKTPICNKNYCKKCLSRYLANITDNNIYLDVYFTMNLECSEHEISRTKEPQNIQECCRNCLEILCFKQTLEYDFGYFSPHHNIYLYNNMIESEKYCKLCGKCLYQGTDDNIMKKFKLCSDCYLISSGYIESTLTKQPISIIYLPWWHNTDSYCNACKLKLICTSDCQKYCANCLIFYTGCRYCLTTNIIFGCTDQSQCKKCKRVSSIVFDITKISSGNSDLDDFFVNLRLDFYNNLKIAEFTDKIKNIDKYFLPYSICNSIYQDIDILMEWMPYSQFTNVKEIANGGFGIIYQATWSDGSKNDIRRDRSKNEIVILKRFKNSQDISKHFLNEVNI